MIDDKQKDIRFTGNEAVSMMHENEAASLRKIADYIQKFELLWQDTVQLLNELADEQEAQSIVVNLRDEINQSK